MELNSYEFIFLFLPVTLTCYLIFCSLKRYQLAASWLLIISLLYYGWWKPVYILLIACSILFNYTTGRTLRHHTRKSILALGILGNICLLGYFKYAYFIVNNLNNLFGTTYHFQVIIFPLAISFFTFKQIAYLVDTYKGKAIEHTFLHYCLFVAFFPQLISGPIVHHQEFLPQLQQDKMYRINYENIAVGLTIFFIGLFKKVILADGIAVYANRVFQAAEDGLLISFVPAWCGAFAYTFQLYFDFSGYTDMAIGVAKMFGILLPINFFSPYQSINIADFWRRWHITLSRFLRDYIYVPLGGNRKGNIQKYTNLMVTMLIGGLWHGAGWTFVLWGALHGFYLVVYHAWRSLCHAIGLERSRSTLWGRSFSRSLTLIAVVAAWVLFRAESLGGALNVLQGMAGLNGFILPESYLHGLSTCACVKDSLANTGIFVKSIKLFISKEELIKLFALFLIIWFLPNTQQFMARYKPAINTYDNNMNRWRYPSLLWRTSFAYGIILGIMALYTLLHLSKTKYFIYSNF